MPTPRGAPATEAAPAPGGRAPRADAADTSKRVCAYSYHRTAQLAAFSAAVGRDISCALVYNNASPDWANWERPWFTIHGDPNFNWAKWKAAVPGRRLIITQALIPSGLAPDWRARGAAGEFEDHARALATNLVASGLGDSVIRLSHEANGTWTLDGLGNDPSQYGLWKTFWARTVRAMRSVPGADFRFDWTINAAYRAIPFHDYYPGDGVVDIIGADVYDFWSAPGLAPTSPSLRWKAQYEQDGGLGDLIRFGRQHRKPLSIPEWGLSAIGHKGGAGDNPYFVDAIAAVVRNNVTAYQSYFESTTDVGMLLTDAPRSLAAYRRHFGG
jgi:Glycosyl hydrolase family 26